MVATIHDVSRGGDGQWMSNRFRRLIGLAETVLYRIPYPQIIAVSQSTADALVQRWGVAARRVQVVPNGIELPPEAAPGEGPARDVDLIYAGRFVPTKNIEDLIEVVRQLHGKGVVGRAMLVGEGPQWETMVARAREAGLADVIEFPGRKSNAEVLEILRRGKVFFHASSREGFPVVMVEAMACGLPVVAYRIPGVVDAIQDRLTGVLVTERDTVSHAAACRQLLEDAPERERLATSGRKQVVQSLTIQAMTDRVEAVYDGDANPGSPAASPRVPWRTVIAVLIAALVLEAWLLGFRQPPPLADDFHYLASTLESDGWPFSTNDAYWGRLPLWYVANWAHFHLQTVFPTAMTVLLFFLLHAIGLLAIVDYLRRSLCPTVPPQLAMWTALPFLLYPCAYEVLLWPTCMPYTIGMALLGLAFTTSRADLRTLLLGLSFLDSEMFILPALALGTVPLFAAGRLPSAGSVARALMPWLGAVLLYAAVRRLVTPPGLAYAFGWTHDAPTVLRQTVLAMAGLFAIHFYDLAVLPTACVWLAVALVAVGLWRSGDRPVQQAWPWVLLVVVASGCHWVIRYPAVRALYGAQMLLVAFCTLAVARCLIRNPAWALAGLGLVSAAFVMQHGHVMSIKRHNEQALAEVEADLASRIAATPPGGDLRLERLDAGLLRAWTLHPDYWPAFARYVQLKHGLGGHVVRFVTVPQP